MPKGRTLFFFVRTATSRATGSSDGDFHSRGNSLQQQGEVRLGLVNIDFHKAMVD
jgi:hypothetical protein